MKSALFFSYLICFIGFSCNNNVVLNDITKLKGNDEISINKWKLIGPLSDSIDNIFYETEDILSPLEIRDNDFNRFKELDSDSHDTQKKITSIPFKKYKDLDIPKSEKFLYEDKWNKKQNISIENVKYRQEYCLDFSEFYQTTGKVSAYAYCEIKSKITQDVAFLIGVDDAVKIWINERLVVKYFTPNGFRKNDLVKKIQLKKGLNKILIKSSNTNKGYWKFKLDITSIKKVTDKFIVKDHLKTSNKCLLSKNEYLKIKMPFRDFLKKGTSGRLILYDSKGDTLFKSKINLKKTTNIQLSEIKNGAYRYTIEFDKNFLESYFYIGDYRDYFDKIKFTTSLNKSGKYMERLMPYINRLHHLMMLSTLGDENYLSEKIAFCLYRIEECQKVKKGSLSSGLHLRQYKSKIDDGIDYYLMYIPYKIKEKDRIPLIINMQYISSNKYPFYRGTIINNMERIKYIIALAEKMNIAVIWPSSRIYTRANSAPIVSNSTLEAIIDVLKEGFVDINKMNLYGDCTGATQALLMAARFPGTFSSIAVEGVELPNVPEIEPGIFELSRESVFMNTPMYFAHSINDQKSPISLVREFINRIQHGGGQLIYNNLRGAVKGNIIPKMFSEQDVMCDVFNFINNHNKRQNIEISLKLKNNFIAQKFGIEVDAEQEHLGFSVFIKKKAGHLIIKASNAKKIYFDIKCIDLIFGSVYSLNVNGNRLTPYRESKGALSLDIHSKHRLKSIKLINKEKQHDHCFANSVLSERFRFLIPNFRNNVSDSCIKYFSDTWKKEYLNNVLYAYEDSLNEYLKKGENIILLDNMKKLNNQTRALLDDREVSRVNKNKLICINTNPTSCYYYVSRHNSGSKILHIGTHNVENSKKILDNIIFNGWKSERVF